MMKYDHQNSTEPGKKKGGLVIALLILAVGAAALIFSWVQGRKEPAEPTDGTETGFTESVPQQTTVPETTPVTKPVAESTSQSIMESEPTSQPVTEPAAQPEIPEESLSQKLTGIYRMDGEDEEVQKIEVTPVGGMLLIEYSEWYEGGLYSFWAEEFWPENSGDLDQTSEISVRGRTNAFSIQSAAGQFFNETETNTISLTDFGLRMVRENQETENWTRISEPVSMHTEPEVLRDRIVTYHSPCTRPEDLAGIWGIRGADFGLAAELSADGSLKYFCKQAGVPMTAMTGGWAVSTDTGSLIFGGECCGWGGMPVTYEMAYEKKKDGSLSLQDTETGSTVQLVPMEADWKFPELDPFGENGHANISTISAVVGDYRNETGVYTPTDGLKREISYVYQLPYIMEDTDGAFRINDAIDSNFGVFTDRQLAYIADGKSAEGYDVGWSYQVYDHLLTLIVHSDLGYACRYGVYRYDLDTGEEVTSEELLQRISLSREEFLEETRAAAEERFVNDCRNMTEEQKKELDYDGALARLDTEECISMEKLMPYLNAEGELMVLAPVPSLAGSHTFYQFLKLPCG